MRATQRVGIDLRWLWGGEADGDMGMRSSFGAMVSRLEAPVSHGRQIVEFDPRCLEAAHRARLILRRLEGVGRAAREVLVAAYGHHSDPPEDIEPVMGVLLGMPEAIAAHSYSRSRRSIQEWAFRLRLRAGAALPSERHLLGKLLRLAEQRLLAAELAYLGVRL